jgi:hypothetical protein
MHASFDKLQILSLGVGVLGQVRWKNGMRGETFLSTTDMTATPRLERLQHAVAGRTRAHLQAVNLGSIAELAGMEKRQPAL